MRIADFFDYRDHVVLTLQQHHLHFFTRMEINGFTNWLVISYHIIFIMGNTCLIP